ncbi:sensor histidine kinase [Clostridium zeae]|uniref:histidine kinase n=1 Tax=Clostridium zeae TaxID=2759022 RepID=A0ABQ1EI14_9CLOT|nr:HAMP domain-containing sensor histidine kinase [Clostridium zeae]GFZ34344.1 sensor histidine kinase [Clostridium zeae]
MRSKKFLKFRFIRWVWNWKIMKPVRLVFKIFKERMEKSIRFELVVTFGICFLISLFCYGIANDILRDNYKSATLVYDDSEIQDRAQRFSNYLINTKDLSITNTSDIQKSVERFYGANANEKVILTDLDGKIVYKTNNVIQNSVDVYATIKYAMDSYSNRYNNQYRTEGKEFVIFYPLNIKDEKLYLFIFATPQARMEYNETYSSDSIMALIIAVVVFVTSFIYITNKKMKYIEEISDGLRKIASGDLSFRINGRGKDELNNLAENINYMASEIMNRIEAERKAEKTKNELITNVSHDLRTPLTSVMGYIGLLKDGKYENEDQMKEYMNIAFNKSEKIKILLEDLFEYTKLTNQGVSLYKEQVNLNEFLSQLIEELMPLFDERGLRIHKDFTEERLEANLDVNKMLRAFENLLGNAIKYSFANTNITVSLKRENEYALISIKNKGENIPREKLEKLFERFYRADESRTSENVSGSGLGLAICKNIVELHSGRIWAECQGNDIKFSVMIRL